MAIRLAKLDDIPELVELSFLMNQTQGDDTQISEDILKEHWNDQDIYVLEKENKLIGFVSGQSSFLFYMGLNRYFINSLFVKKAFQGQGFGQQLIDFIIQTKSKEGFQRFELQVLKDNKIANNLYQKNAFKLKPDIYNKLSLKI